MQTVTRARRLRADMTLPEVLLWQQLRQRPEGLKFRRQHPAGDCVLDFYCASARLAVEIDGQVHADTTARDANRDAWLAARGVRTLRLSAALVMSDMAAAVAAIVAAASPDQPLHRPADGPPPQASLGRMVTP